MNQEGNSESKVIVFTCNWSPFAQANTAGVRKVALSPSFRMVRLMCLGRIQPAMILKAFELGADGVLILGCGKENCHYDFGSKKGEEHFQLTARLLHLLGIDENRLKLHQDFKDSATFTFARVVEDFIQELKG
jgi:coenzyme F420-reducing hydrogenase delta subunit